MQDISLVLFLKLEDPDRRFPFSGTMGGSSRIYNPKQLTRILGGKKCRTRLSEPANNRQELINIEKHGNPGRNVYAPSRRYMRSFSSCEYYFMAILTNLPTLDIISPLLFILRVRYHLPGNTYCPPNIASLGNLLTPRRLSTEAGPTRDGLWRI